MIIIYLLRITPFPPVKWLKCFLDNFCVLCNSCTCIIYMQYINTVNKYNTQIQNISFYFCTKYSQNVVGVLPISYGNLRQNSYVIKTTYGNKEEHTQFGIKPNAFHIIRIFMVSNFDFWSLLPCLVGNALHKGLFNRC